MCFVSFPLLDYERLVIWVNWLFKSLIGLGVESLSHTDSVLSCFLKWHIVSRSQPSTGGCGGTQISPHTASASEAASEELVLATVHTRQQWLCQAAQGTVAGKRARTFAEDSFSPVTPSQVEGWADRAKHLFSGAPRTLRPSSPRHFSVSLSELEPCPSHPTSHSRGRGSDIPAPSGLLHPLSSFPLGRQFLFHKAGPKVQQHQQQLKLFAQKL